jgi:hypothetical protein
LQSEPAARDTSALPRHIGWFTAGCVLVSNVVGSGIFTTTGLMARDLGHPGLILSVWLTGALIALAGALTYKQSPRSLRRNSHQGRPLCSHCCGAKLRAFSSQILG